MYVSTLCLRSLSLSTYIDLLWTYVVSYLVFFYLISLMICIMSLKYGFNNSGTVQAGFF